MINYERLMTLIKQKGKTKTYLCKKLGRGAYFLRDAQNANQDIPEEFIRILADELNTSYEYLTNQTDCPDAKQPLYASTKNEEKLLTLFRQLSEIDQMRVIVRLNDMCKSSDEISVAIAEADFLSTDTNKTVGTHE